MGLTDAREKAKQVCQYLNKNERFIVAKENKNYLIVPLFQSGAANVQTRKNSDTCRHAPSDTPKHFAGHRILLLISDVTLHYHCQSVTSIIYVIFVIIMYILYN